MEQDPNRFMLQVRRTARRFEPSAMLSALRSFVALAAPSGSARLPASSGATPAAVDGGPGGPEAAALRPAFVLPADVVDALAGDIRVRHLQFSKLQRSEVSSRCAAGPARSLHSLSAMSALC